MLGGGFFRGTSQSQDFRFENKTKKLRKKMKFPAHFKKRVNLARVNRESVNEWIRGRSLELLGLDDEVITNMAINLVQDAEKPDPRDIQIQLTPYFGARTPEFVSELWLLLLDASASPNGEPSNFLQQERVRIAREREKQLRIEQGLAERAGRQRAEVSRAAAREAADAISKLNAKFKNLVPPLPGASGDSVDDSASGAATGAAPPRIAAASSSSRPERAASHSRSRSPRRRNHRRGGDTSRSTSRSPQQQRRRGGGGSRRGADRDSSRERSVSPSDRRAADRGGYRDSRRQSRRRFRSPPAGGSSRSRSRSRGRGGGGHRRRRRSVSPRSRSASSASSDDTGNGGARRSGRRASRRDRSPVVRRRRARSPVSGKDSPPIKREAREEDAQKAKQEAALRAKALAAIRGYDADESGAASPPTSPQSLSSVPPVSQH